MGFNGEKVIIFWSQPLYALDYTYVVWYCVVLSAKSQYVRRPTALGQIQSNLTRAEKTNLNVRSTKRPAEGAKEQKRNTNIIPYLLH